MSGLTELPLDNPRGIFRSSLWVLPSLALFAVVVSGVYGAYRTFIGGRDFDWLRESFLIITPIIVLACIPLALFWKVKIYDWGIRGYDSFGMYRYAPWQEIHGVERKTIWPGMTYLVLTTPNRDLFTSIWLPLFLKGMPQFRSLVIELAPPGHPLRQYFESN